MEDVDPMPSWFSPIALAVQIGLRLVGIWNNCVVVLGEERGQ